MKRSVFIIIGVILVVVLLIVWVYVLFIGTPAGPADRFADLGFGDTTDNNYQEPVPDPQAEAVVDLNTNKRLRQLTTQPVAGYIEIAASTSSPATVLYAEVGTGHIFSINLSTGEEQRISGTTIPAAQKAMFTPNGQYVMFESGFGSKQEFIIGEINSENHTLSNTELDEPITSFSDTTDNHFLYSIQANASTIGKIFDPVAMTSETLFTLPFRESSIDWGRSVTAAHYIYPKATRQLESFLYRVKNGDITRMPVDGYGMSAVGSDSYIVFSKQEKDDYRTYFLDIKNNERSSSPLVQIPEKCVMGEGEFPVTICANTEFQYSSLLPDSWYKGEVASADNLWEFYPEEGSATLLSNTELDSGRQLDIINLDLSADGTNIYFTNQTDQTLWMYQRIANDFN